MAECNQVEASSIGSRVLQGCCPNLLPTAVGAADLTVIKNPFCAITILCRPRRVPLLRMKRSRVGPAPVRERCSSCGGTEVSTSSMDISPPIWMLPLYAPHSLHRSRRAWYASSVRRNTSFYTPFRAVLSQVHGNEYLAALAARRQSSAS